MNRSKLLAAQNVPADAIAFDEGLRHLAAARALLDGRSNVRPNHWRSRVPHHLDAAAACFRRAACLGTPDEILDLARASWAALRDDYRGILPLGRRAA